MQSRITLTPFSEYCLLLPSLFLLLQEMKSSRRVGRTSTIGQCVVLSVWDLSDSVDLYKHPVSPVCLVPTRVFVLTCAAGWRSFSTDRGSPASKADLNAVTPMKSTSRISFLAITSISAVAGFSSQWTEQVVVILVMADSPSSPFQFFLCLIRELVLNALPD